MLDPMMTFIACVRSRSPDDTKPTAITVMIELDWTMIVETHPVATPARRWVVANAMKRLKPLPLTACKPSDRCFIPSRNVPRPPATVRRTINMSFIIAANYTKTCPVPTVQTTKSRQPLPGNFGGGSAKMSGLASSPHLSFIATLPIAPRKSADGFTPPCSSSLIVVPFA